MLPISAEKSALRTLKYRFVFTFSLIIITYLATFDISETPLVDIHDKLQHFMSFIWLAFFLDFSWPQKPFNTSKFILLFCYGVSLELIQYNLPYREFSLGDILANSTGLIAYVLAQQKLLTLPCFDYRRALIDNKDQESI